ncbi:MAG: hypothetical protein IJU63_05505 [Bacteroidales bacterium]|nr:hypothetical protein [Bacteroidales bacterium]
MNCKLVVRPIVGCLTHSHFWEGPCRAGYAKDMTPEAEAAAADRAFREAVDMLRGATPEIEMLPAVDARYDETFVVPREVYAQIEERIGEVDFFLCMNWRIPKLERYRKTVVILQNGNEGIDFAAYCRSIGVEAHVCMDLRDLNDIAHALWVRKVVANTRALVLTHGSMPTFGLQSLIRDPELIRSRYGMEIVKLPFRDIFPYMDRVSDEEACPIAERILGASLETKVNKEWFLNDVKYYLAARKMMDAYDCNAFTTACHELCTSEIPQNRKFTPCTCHSLMKDEGYPSGCEEDLNALLAMTVMQAAAMRPAFMGNPNLETDEMIRLHHAVPALRMNGYDRKPLRYKLWAFTGQGFGGKLQVDFTENEEKYVTLGRFNPQADTLSLGRGEVIKSEFEEVYCSPYYYIKMRDARAFMHQLAGFGHHQVLVFGDWSAVLERIAGVMGFKIEAQL